MRLPVFERAGRIDLNEYLFRAGLLLGGVILLFFFFRFFEKSNLYFPFKKLDGTPADIGLNFEDVNITASDGISINAWFIPSALPRAAIIFSHGNGGNISHRLEKILILNNLNFDVLIYDYRGYGQSKGRPGEDGLYLDAEAVYKYLVNERRISSGRIIAFGESLGAAVSIDLALKHELRGVIIEEGFTSVKDVAKHYLPFIPAIIYKSKYDSLEKIKNVHSPKLFFHSIDDEIIPYDFGKRLFEAAPEPKMFVNLRGGHNDAFLVSKDLFIKGIDDFVKEMGK
ncbi:MAG: alpha/beta hydrolase [Nitrospirae bacterium]|nr:alpha/beta hydrolase [Nitrospirota bacterium]